MQPIKNQKNHNSKLVQPILKIQLDLSMAAGMISYGNMGKKLGGQTSNFMERLRLDPHRGLEPPRKKLTTLETQRVMGVLDEKIKRVEIISALPSIIDNLDDFKIMLGRELTEQIESYTELQEEYDTLSAKMDALLGRKRLNEEQQMEREETVFTDDFWTRPKSEQSKSSRSSNTLKAWAAEYSPEEMEEMRKERHNIQDNMSELQPHIQFAVRNLLIGFRNNPTAVKAVTEQRLERNIHRSRGVTRALERLAELRDIMMLRLMTTPSERDERMTFVSEIEQRQRGHIEAIEKLDQQLQMTQNHKDGEIKKKNDVIRKLQADIHQIQQYSEESIKRTKMEADKQKASDEKNSDGKKQKLSQEILLQRTQLSNLVEEHRHNEENLRNEKLKLETRLENQLQKYDEAMGERQSEYEEVDAVYTEEKKQLNELQERFKTLEEEYMAIMEERRIAQEKREAAEREFQMLIQAATTIQAFWRSFKVRKQVRGKRGKGGKGKGKKK